LGICFAASPITSRERMVANVFSSFAAK